MASWILETSSWKLVSRMALLIALYPSLHQLSFPITLIPHLNFYQSSPVPNTVLFPMFSQFLLSFHCVFWNSWIITSNILNPLSVPPINFHQRCSTQLRTMLHYSSSHINHTIIAECVVNVFLDHCCCQSILSPSILLYHDSRLQ